MAVYYNGDTVTLNTWLTGSIGGGVGKWMIRASDTNGGPILIASETGSPGTSGWTVTLTSGSYGNTNAVFNITVPAGLSRYDYRVYIDFVHCDGVTASTAKTAKFVVDATTIIYPRSPVHDAVLHGGEVWTATLESDGVRIQSFTNAASRTLRGTKAGVYLPSITFDDSGVLWMSACERSETYNTDLPKIYKSVDGGRSFTEVGAHPTTLTTFSETGLRYLGNNVFYATGKSRAPAYSGHISRDGGATWVSLPALSQSTRFVQRHAGRINSVGKRQVVYFTSDWGRTTDEFWNALELRDAGGRIASISNAEFICLTPDGVGLAISLNATGGDAIWFGRLLSKTLTNVPFSIYTANFSTAVVVNEVGYTYPTGANALSNLFTLLHDPSSNRIIVTDARAINRFSDDFGRTWGNL